MLSGIENIYDRIENVYETIELIKVEFNGHVMFFKLIH